MPVQSITITVELPLVVDFITTDRDIKPTVTFVRYNGRDITDVIPPSKLRELQDDIMDLEDLA